MILTNDGDLRNSRAFTLKQILLCVCVSYFFFLCVLMFVFLFVCMSVCVRVHSVGVVTTFAHVCVYCGCVCVLSSKRLCVSYYFTGFLFATFVPTSAESTDESFLRALALNADPLFVFFRSLVLCGSVCRQPRSVEFVVLEAVVLFAVRDELFLVNGLIILIPSLYPRFLHGIQYSSIITASPVRAVVVAVPSVRPLHTPADGLRRRWRHQLLWLCDRIARIPP